MNDTHLYELFLEVKNETDSGVACDADGAFVMCYVWSLSLEEAISNTKLKLDADNFTLIDLIQVIRIHIEEWVPHDQDYPSKSDLQSLSQTGESIYGPFDSYNQKWEH